MTRADQPVHGPQTGAPPSLEQVPIDRLHVDPAYQRATDTPLSRRIIAGMVREWKWALCQPLVVSRRIDGLLFVIDGQHRLAGARARGDLPYLPCVILSSLDLAGEARAFVGLNTEHQRLSQADKFNGMLAFGDPDAQRVSALLEATGWRIVRSTNTQGMKPGDLTCAPMLVRELKWSSEEIVRHALVALRTGYPGTPISNISNMLQALIQLFKRHTGHDPVQVAEVLALRPPVAWAKLGNDLCARDSGLTRIKGLTRAIHNEVEKLRGGVKAPATPALTPRAVTAPAKDAAAPGGRTWCDQCEQLVTSARIAACASPFCAAKAKAA